MGVDSLCMKYAKETSQVSPQALEVGWEPSLRPPPLWEGWAPLPCLRA